MWGNGRTLFNGRSPRQSAHYRWHWDTAVVENLTDDSELLLMQEDHYLYLAIRSVTLEINGGGCAAGVVDYLLQTFWNVEIKTRFQILQ